MDTGRSASIPFEQPSQVANDLTREESLNFSASTSMENEFKRKLQEEEASKRVRQRTGEVNHTVVTTS